MIYFGSDNGESDRNVFEMTHQRGSRLHFFMRWYWDLLKIQERQEQLKLSQEIRKPALHIATCFQDNNFGDDQPKVIL